jgi:hypothetical protein
MNKLILLSGLFILFSCSVRENNHSNNHEITSVLFSDENTLLLNDSLSCEFIPLETLSDNSNLIGHILKAVISENRMFILDAVRTKSLQVYTLQGEYITRIGEIGNGPGEYILPHNFYINEDKRKVTIEDLAKNTLLVYDLDTYQYEYEKRIPFNFMDYIETPEGFLWCDLNGFKKARDSYYIRMTDSILEDIKYIYPTDFRSAYNIKLGDLFYHINGKIHFVHPLKPIVYELDSEDIHPIYELSLGEIHFPTLDYLQSISKNNIDHTGVLLRSGYIANYSLYETDRFMLISYLVNQQMNIGLYEKETMKSFKYNQIDFARITHLEGINLPFIGTYNDAFITTILPHNLQNHYIINDKLRAIAQNISEEDNPILCLIKFK